MNQYFIEQLIASVQASLWLILLGLLFGLDSKVLPDISDNEFVTAQIGLIFFAFIYPLGILTDGCAGFISNSFQDRIKVKALNNSELPEKDKKYELGSNKSKDTVPMGTTDMLIRVGDISQLADGFTFFRRTSRILGSTALNSRILLFVLPIYLNKHNYCDEALISVYSLITLILLSIVGWFGITKKYYEKIFEAIFKYDEYQTKIKPERIES